LRRWLLQRPKLLLLLLLLAAAAAVALLGEPCALARHLQGAKTTTATTSGEGAGNLYCSEGATSTPCWQHCAVLWHG
jgi:hypothetical protein